MCWKLSKLRKVQYEEALKRVIVQQARHERAGCTSPYACEKIGTASKMKCNQKQFAAKQFT